MWSVKHPSLYSSHFISLQNWNLRSFVHRLFSLSLHLSCLVKSVWGTLGIFCECAPHMCDMVPQVEDWGLDQDTQPSPCVQADQAEHSLFWASPSFFGPSVCEYSTGWGQGTGLSWTRIQTQAPLCVLDVAHTRAMTVKVCVHSPKHYLNEDMTTWL